jgi:hypothetical protein
MPTINNMTKRPYADAIGFRQGNAALAMCVPQSDDVFYFRRKLAVVEISCPKPSILGGMLRIHQWSSRKNVQWIDTDRRVAPMTGEKLFWHQSLMKDLPAFPMCGDTPYRFSSVLRAGGKPPITISVSPCSPWPAAVQAPFFMQATAYMRPEPHFLMRFVPIPLASVATKFSRVFGEITGGGQEQKQDMTVLTFTKHGWHSDPFIRGHLGQGRYEAMNSRGCCNTLRP